LEERDIDGSTIHVKEVGDKVNYTEVIQFLNDGGGLRNIFII